VESDSTVHLREQWRVKTLHCVPHVCGKQQRAAFHKPMVLIYFSRLHMNNKPKRLIAVVCFKSNSISDTFLKCFVNLAEWRLEKNERCGVWLKQNKSFRLNWHNTLTLGGILKFNNLKNIYSKKTHRVQNNSVKARFSVPHPH
jgi:hypothetical protein